MSLKTNLKHWFDRYKYAELTATTFALLVSHFHTIFSGLTTAYLITFAEYFAFYGIIIFTSYKKLIQKNKQINRKTTASESFLILKNLLLEFGYPGIFDFCFIRPFFMYWMPIIIGNFFGGIILGKVLADLCFYTQAIINYEIIKYRAIKLKKQN